MPQLLLLRNAKWVKVSMMRLVTENSVSETRAALTEAANSGDKVVGWVDLTSPHLVDLIDELQRGPGGECLVALRCSLFDIGELCATRGLASLERAGLALYADRDDVATQAAEKFPRLVLIGPDTPL
jgi:hypothetical protein